MKRWTKFFGILGAVILVFGMIGGLVTSDFANPLVMFHLILGAVTLLIWFVNLGLSGMQDTKQVLIRRAARFSVNAFLYSVVFLGLFGIVNWMVNRHDKRWDLTEDGAYSLSDQSAKIVKGLSKPLKMVAFKGIEPQSEDRIEELFQLYHYNNSSKVKTEIVDPRSKPHLLEKYQMKQGNLVYLEYGEGESSGVSRINEVTEEAITNALLKLARGEAKKVYIVQGHDEPSIEGASPGGLKKLVDAIGDEHISVEGIILSKKDEVPSDAASVLFVSPKKSLLPQEKEVLIKYVEKGGRLLMLADPRIPADIKEIADHFGVEVGDNIVIDQVQRLFAGPALGAQPVVQTYGSHAITNNFSPQSVTIYNVASTVRPKGKGDEKATYTEIVKTGSTAWGEVNLSQVFDSDEPSAVYDKDSDLSGPVSLAVAYEKKLESPKGNSDKKDEQDQQKSPQFEEMARLVVFGDSDWILNANLGVYSNRDLILNAINWLNGEEGGISIRPASLKSSLQPIQADAFRKLFTVSFVAPEVILLLGLFIWWQRRVADLA